MSERTYTVSGRRVILNGCSIEPSYSLWRDLCRCSYMHDYSAPSGMTFYVLPDFLPKIEKVLVGAMFVKV